MCFLYYSDYECCLSFTILVSCVAFVEVYVTVKRTTARSNLKIQILAVKNHLKDEDKTIVDALTF